MLKKLLLFVAAAFVGSFAFAQDSPETATVIDDIATYEGTDYFVFSKADRRVYALNNLGKYEKFGIYEKVYTLKAAGVEGEVDYIESAAESTRNNVIPTDYIPTTTTRAEGIFEYDSKFFHDWNALFGVGYYLNGWKNLFTYFGQTNYGRGGIQSSDETVDTHGSVTWDKKSKFVLDANTARGTQYDMEGNVLSYIQQAEAPKTMDCVTPLYILGMNKTVPAYTDADGVDHDEEPIVDCQAPGAKFFGLKIYEGEKLVRDFVPYVQDGKVGAYDKVNNVFWPATEGEDFTPLTAGSVTTYEGKIVRNLDDGHIYKFFNGAWSDYGEATFEEIENEDYKDLNNWETNPGHAGIFADGNIAFDNGNNYIDNYIGTGGFEPLMTKVTVEENTDYRFSFDYLNTNGTWGWSNWSARAAVWAGWDTNTSATFAFAAGDADVFGSQLIGHEKSEDYVPVSIDFNPTKTDPTLVLQFGYYADGASFMFEFNNLKVEKYVYPVEYPVINPDDFAEVEPTRWDADGVGYAAIKGGNGNNDGETWNKIVDNDATTKFCGSVINAWFMIQADQPVVVKQYSIVTGADTYTYTARNPRAWTLEGSNDKVNWTIIDKVQDYDLIEARNCEEKVFVPSYVPEEEETGAKESTSTEAFKYFRFTVNDARDGVQIGEFWINEQAHEWANTETIEPTCCKQGQSIATCADCGAKKTTWIPETNAHTYDDACLTDYDVTLVNMSESKDNAHHFKAKRSYFERGNADSWADINGEGALAWTEVGFDDSDWDTLTLPMGDFGNYNTYWGGENNAYQIRMPFVIDDASKVDELIFQALHDDTYWVYLNGELILQVDNWNNGSNVSDLNSWDLLSSTGEQSFPNGGTEVVNYAEPIPLELLQDGENVLAVYIQENWGGQYFDCRLSAMGTPTGVKNVETQTTAGKNEVYDLQGRKMNSKNLPKGIYIINGKKVVK